MHDCIPVEGELIYFLRRADGAIKIGTTGNYHMRLSQLMAQHGDLELLGIMQGGREMEQWLHRQFDETRIDGRHEWFTPNGKLLKFIENKAILELPPKTPIVSIRLHPTNRAVIDYVIAQNTVKLGRSMTLDEALWFIFTHGAKEAVDKVLSMGAKPPVDARKEELKRRAKKRRDEQGD